MKPKDKEVITEKGAKIEMMEISSPPRAHHLIFLLTFTFI
jgi:hypothetical protein